MSLGPMAAIHSPSKITQLPTDDADDGWQQFSLPVLYQDAATFTLIVDSEFFDSNPHLTSNPSEWDDESNIKAVCPESFPGARVFIARTHGGRCYRGQIVAVQLELKDYDASSGTRLLHSRLSQWSEELTGSSDKRTPAVSYDRRGSSRSGVRAPVDPLSKAQYVPTSSDPDIYGNSANRPTLFSLLSRLSDASITTVEQRFAIRQIITDYLNNEIPHGKVFSYLGQVVGYDALDEIISSLPPGKAAGSPTSLVYSKIQQSMQLQQPLKKGPGVVLGTSPDIDDAVHVRQSAIRFTPSVSDAINRTDDLSNDKIRHEKALLIRSFVKPLTWLSPSDLQFKSLMSWGQIPVMFDRRAFYIGGVPRTQPIQESPDDVAPPTLESIRVLSLANFESSYMKTFDTPPPSMTGHSSHITQFASGPLTIVYGGMIYNSDYHNNQNRIQSPVKKNPPSSSSPDSDIQLNTTLYGLDMITRKWIILDTGSKLKPPPRHSHVSTVIPNDAEVTSIGTSEYGKHLIIFGGIGSSKWKPTDEQNKHHQCKIKELQLLNDLWIYNFNTGEWKEIDLSYLSPSPRYGSCFVWLSTSSLVLYGGETRLTTSTDDYEGDAMLGAPPGKRQILADGWILHMKEEPESPIGENSDSTLDVAWCQSPVVGPPRAHYAAVGLTACLPPHTTNKPKESHNTNAAIWSSTVETAMKDLTSLGWLTQRVILLISGTTQNADGFIYETPSVICGLVFPKPPPVPQPVSTEASATPELQQSPVESADIIMGDTPDTAWKIDYLMVWKSINNIAIGSGQLGMTFKGRRNHSAIYFDSVAELPCDRMMEAELKQYSMKLHEQVPEITSDDDEEKSQLLQFSKTPTSAPCILVIGGLNKDHICEDVWVLKLSKLIPKFLRYENKNRSIEKKLLMGLMLSGVKCSPSLRQLLQTDDDEDNKTGFNIEELKIMKSVWTDPQKNYQPGLYQSGLYPSYGLVWSLITMVRHPFSALSHLVDNSIQRHVKAHNISICFETWHEWETITVTDDGSGVTHKGLHLLLKRFGHSNDDLTNNQPDQFGIGFKIGVGRLAHNALVITKTPWTYGAGLFSAPLNSLLGTTNFVCPIACWSCTDGFPITYEDSAFSQNLGMILRNTPLGTAENLKAEFERFENSTGTRIVLFGLRKDIPYLRFTREHQLTLSSLRSPQLFKIPTSDDIRGRPITNRSTDMKPESDENNSDGINIDQTNDKKRKLEEEFDCDEPPNKKSKPNDRAIINLPNGLSNITAVLENTFELPKEFPLWEGPHHSIDYNLATYLYWSQLHSEPLLHINGVELIPSEIQQTENTTSSKSGIELPDQDRYSSSLYRYLQHRLHYKLELPFLFDPKFGEDNFYGIVGFLNDDLSDDPKPRVCESGVLLYHKGRLINRIMLKIPVIPEFIRPPPINHDRRVSPSINILNELVFTAVINVPDFLIPRATKEEFMLETDVLVFHEFYDRLEKALKEYLEVYWDSSKLAALQTRYCKDFDDYRDAEWMRRRKGLSFCDSVQSAETSESDEHNKRRSLSSDNRMTGDEDSPTKDRHKRRRSPSTGREAQSAMSRQRDRKTGRYK